MLSNFFSSFFSHTSGTVMIVFFCGLIFGGLIVFWALMEKKEVEEAEEVADETESYAHFHPGEGL